MEGKDITSIIRRAAAILCAMLLLPIASWPVGTARAETAGSSQFTRSDLSGLSSVNWMSGIDGERLITEINLPGTHDSATHAVFTYSVVSPLYHNYAVCQKLSIREQLMAGVRYLDLRLSNTYDYRPVVLSEEKDDGKNLWLVHGDHQSAGINGRFFCYDKKENGEWSELSLDEVLKIVTAFLKEHPTETVILCVSRESGTKGKSGDDQNKDVYPRVKEHLTRYQEYVYHPQGTHEEMPTLNQCRGKMVILSSQPKLTGYGTQYAGSFNASTVDEANWYPTMKLGDQVTYFENHYEAKDKDKETWVRSFFTAFQHVHIPADPTVRIGHANHVQISSNAFTFVSGGRYPSEIAAHMNPVVYTGKNPIVSEAGRFYGWILSDFITEDIAARLWKTNFPNHVHRLTGPSEGIAPTCTKEGKKSYYTCADCGKLFLDGQGILEVQSNDLTLPATGGHEPGAPAAEKVVPATANADGHYEEVVRCSKCGEEISRKTVTLSDRPSAKSVPYIDEYGSTRYCNSYTWFDTLPVRGGWGIGPEGSGWYVVRKSQEISDYRMTISGHVNLILQDGATLTIYPGIRLTPGASLTVWGQSGKTGRLISTSGSSGYSGIGGDKKEAAGTFILHSGNVGAQGGKSAAGIGGGDGGSGGEVIIYGGDLAGLGGNYGAGIGGGEDANGGNVTIYGGSVRATAGCNAAGIGGGYAGSQGGNVTIYGGSVTATGGACGAGIGGGEYYRGGGHGGNVTIYGGKISATGGESGAGIGGGKGGDQGGEVKIAGGEVKAEGGKRGAGIGGGEEETISASHGGKGGHVTITGGRVSAVGNDTGGGIGNGGTSLLSIVNARESGSKTYKKYKEDVPFSGVLKITGGTVIAHGGNANAVFADNVDMDAYISYHDGPAATALKVASCDLAPAYRVRVGDSESGMTAANKEDRKNHGRRNRWAVIEICDHAQATPIISEKGHLMYCQTCKKMLSGEEPHVFENNICKVCHYHAKVTHQVTFDGNGGIGTMAAVQVPEEQKTYKLPKSEFTPPDPDTQFFAGWEVSGNVRQPGEEITIGGNTAVKALWDVCHHITAVRTETVRSCTEQGYTEKKIYCTLCFTELSTVRTPLAPVGHKWGDWVILEAPTETEAGRAMQVCENDPSHVECMDLEAGAETAFHYYVSKEGMTWKKTSEKELSLHFHRSVQDEETYDRYLNLTVDDEEELEDNQDFIPVGMTDGGLEVLLQPAWLKNLEPGWHEVTVWFADGYADASFLVEVESTIPQPSPAPGLVEEAFIHELIIPDTRPKEEGTIQYAIGGGVAPIPEDEPHGPAVSPTPTPGGDDPIPTPEGSEPTATPEGSDPTAEPTRTPGRVDPTPTPGRPQPTATPGGDDPTPTPAPLPSPAVNGITPPKNQDLYSEDIPMASSVGVYYIWTQLLGNDGYTHYHPDRPLPVLIEDPDYRVVSGHGMKWVTGTQEDLVFQVKRKSNDAVTYKNFHRLEIDRVTVDPEDYETNQGSLILRLKASKLASLEPGYHALYFVFTDGVAVTYISAENPVPETFSFRKQWSGGQERGIEFTLYQSDGTEYPGAKFTREKISETEWLYSAEIASAYPCYVVEKSMAGYSTIYVNEGKYAKTTDRLYSGGTLVNKKIPKTGDEANPLLWAGCGLVGLAGLVILFLWHRRRNHIS